MAIAVGSAFLAATALALETNAPSARVAKSINASRRARLHHLSPVEFFRGLLSMSPREREQALADRSPADKAILLAKVKEYLALPRDVREARLCQTELHWELSGLMQLAPNQRANRLSEVSPLYQPMVIALLRQWDKVPAETQKALLENQNFIGIYLHLQGASPAAQQDMIDKLPPARRAAWTEELGRWQALPAAERAELCAQFQQFCSLSPPEQQQTVETLSGSDRRVMQTALREFDLLPPAQRAQCIGSFQKFATMAPEERNQFLKNAARWDSMNQHERQLWGRLVQTLPSTPPMPPGLLPGPPLPPGFQQWLHSMPPLPPMPPNVAAPVIVARALKGAPQD